MLRMMRQSIALFSLVLVTWAGVVSQLQAAPDRDAIARAQYLAVTGASAADLCLSGADDAAHHCPLCHKLPKGPRITHDAPVFRAVWALPDLRRCDLVSGAKPRGLAVAPRGPPVTI